MFRKVFMGIQWHGGAQPFPLTFSVLVIHSGNLHVPTRSETFGKGAGNQPGYSRDRKPMNIPSGSSFTQLEKMVCLQIILKTKEQQN